MKTCFYLKRDCMKMGKHAKTFHVNKGLAIFISLYTNSAIFKREICGRYFERYLHENYALHTPVFYMKMSNFNIVFHMTRKNGNIFSP